MITSARNQFSGVVSAHAIGAVNDEIEITLGSGMKIVAVVTRESADALGLQVGKEVFALIKASSVIVAGDLEGAKLSARNQFPGTVCAVTMGSVNAEIELEIDGGETMVSIVTNGSVNRLGLMVGKKAVAIIKASSIIVGTPA